MNRYKIVDRATFQTIHVFGTDAHEACLLSGVPWWRATIYKLVEKEGEGVYVKIMGGARAGEQPEPS